MTRKSSPQDIAQALVEMTRVIPDQDYAQACDSALHLLQQSGDMDLHSFPGRVLAALEENQHVLFATLTTPDGEIDAEQKKRFVRSLEKLFGKKVHLELQKDESLLGGATLRIGDELYDVSIKGEIQRVTQHFLTGHFQP